MQESTMCFSNQEKPGKDELPLQMRNWMFTDKYCAECDRKRSTVCNDPNCTRSNAH